MTPDQDVEFMDRTALKDEVRKLRNAIRELHSQHADDLCWMPADINKVFAAVGLPPQDLRVGDTEAMLRNCSRYVSCLQNGGPRATYAELENRIKELEGQNKGLVLRNRVLRARPDLSVERMNFHDALATAQEELAKLRDR